ncbi:MAG: ABC transporter ATP-binding protein, partial [Cereibacter sp.]
MPRADIDWRADRAAGIHRIGPLPDRKPGALSGGRCLQVATGRTPVRDADLFLFDGPPSNPDAKPRSGRR